MRSLLRSPASPAITKCIPLYATAQKHSFHEKSTSRVGLRDGRSKGGTPVTLSAGLPARTAEWQADKHSSSRGHERENVERNPALRGARETDTWFENDFVFDPSKSKVFGRTKRSSTAETPSLPTDAQDELYKATAAGEAGRKPKKRLPDHIQAQLDLKLAKSELDNSEYEDTDHVKLVQNLYSAVRRLRTDQKHLVISANNGLIGHLFNAFYSKLNLLNEDLFKAKKRVARHVPSANRGRLPSLPLATEPLLGQVSSNIGVIMHARICALETLAFLIAGNTRSFFYFTPRPSSPNTQHNTGHPTMAKGGGKGGSASKRAQARKASKKAAAMEAKTETTQGTWGFAVSKGALEPLRMGTSPVSSAPKNKKKRKQAKQKAEKQETKDVEKPEQQEDIHLLSDEQFPRSLVKWWESEGGRAIMVRQNAASATKKSPKFEIVPLYRVRVAAKKATNDTESTASGAESAAPSTLTPESTDQTGLVSNREKLESKKAQLVRLGYEIERVKIELAMHRVETQVRQLLIARKHVTRKVRQVRRHAATMGLLG